MTVVDSTFFSSFLIGRLMVVDGNVNINCINEDSNTSSVVEFVAVIECTMQKENYDAFTIIMCEITNLF